MSVTNKKATENNVTTDLDNDGLVSQKIRGK